MKLLIHTFKNGDTAYSTSDSITMEIDGEKPVTTTEMHLPENQVKDVVDHPSEYRFDHTHKQISKITHQQPHPHLGK